MLRRMFLSLAGESSVEYYCEERPRTSVGDIRGQGSQNKHPDFLVSSPSHFLRRIPVKCVSLKSKDQRNLLLYSIHVSLKRLSAGTKEFRECLWNNDRRVISSDILEFS